MSDKTPVSEHRIILILALIVIFILAVITINLNFNRIDNQAGKNNGLFDNVINKLKNSVNQKSTTNTYAQ